MFVTTGYTPFDRDTQNEEMLAIMAGDYKFEPGMFDVIKFAYRILMLDL